MSVRDYQLKECLKRNEDLTIKFQDKSMFIPHDKVKNYTRSGVVIPAQYGKNPTYELLDFDWKPDNKQLNLFN